MSALTFEDRRELLMECDKFCKQRRIIKDPRPRRSARYRPSFYTEETCLYADPHPLFRRSLSDLPSPFYADDLLEQLPNLREQQLKAPSFYAEETWERQRIIDEIREQQRRRVLDVQPAILGQLQQADLITSEECRRLKVRYYISRLVDLQKGKSPEVMSKSAKVLRRHGLEKESRLLAVNAALAELRQAHLITSEECSHLKYFLQQDDIDIRHDLISSEECKDLQHISGMVRVQKGKSPEVVFQIATVLRKHGLKQESRLLTGYLPHHADKVDLHHLVEDEWSRLSSEYHSLKTSVGAVLERLPEQSRLLFRQVYRTLSSTARRMCKNPKASKVLDARDLRRQIEALHDPELLQQLSSYEEDNLKPFIVNFLVRCRGTGVQPDSSQPDVVLSPSTPAGQVLGFILSRKDYYITDLHIDREHFSPWDVDTPPPARVPPTLEGPGHQRPLDGLISSYSALFTKVVENVETLPRQQYLNLKYFFQYQPHTEVHLPSSQMDVCNHLQHTPLFAPLCTALLRKVVWFLFTRDADDLSHKLGDYEKKLVTFVSQFLRACHVEDVVPPTGGMNLPEDGCDLSDPAHFLVCVLALKPYYVGSLHVDESLFTALEGEGSLEGEGGWEEYVSMDASPLEPTPPTSESGSSGSSVPPQSKGKGKHRVGTSPSAVPAKRSAQEEGREDKVKEEDEEKAAGSSAKRKKREESHMTGASQSGTGTGTDSGSDVILSQMVSDRPNHLMLFRKNVSRAAAGKGRAVLEGVWLDAPTIEACFRSNPLDEEAAVQAGLTKWVEGKGRQPPTWEALIEALEDAEMGPEHLKRLKTDLGLLKQQPLLS